MSEKVTSHVRDLSLRRGRLDKFTLVSLSFVIFSLVATIGYVGLQLTEKHTPRGIVAVQIEVEVSQFHLWFEEAASGDKSVQLETVWGHLDAAEVYAKTLLEGGKVRQDADVVMPLTIPGQRGLVRSVLDGIRNLRVAGEHRLSLGEGGGVGTDKDQQFDQKFTVVLEYTRQIGDAIHQETSRMTWAFRWLVGALGAVIAVLMALMTYMFFRYDRSITSYVNDLRRAEEDLQEASENLHLYERIFTNSGEAILITDKDERIIQINPAFTRLTGYTLKDIKGNKPAVLSSGDIPNAVHDEMWRALNAYGYWQGELMERNKFDRIYPKWTAISRIQDANGETTHYAASYTDISERKAAEERIHRLAHYDSLTGLLNRFSLDERLQQALLLAWRNHHMLAVMFIDMDRFKTINDTLGHHVGDELLVVIARRLHDAVRESDIVARIGGDEFVVVLTNVDGSEHVASVAAKISASLNEKYVLGEHELHSSPSVGVSMFPGDGDTADKLLMLADSAMYSAKDAGRNTVRFFSPKMSAESSRRMELERDLPGALENDEFVLVYQPQIKTETNEIRGFEALIRWNHPDRGQISPMQFIPVAEQTGIIEKIGDWVLTEACRQLAQWKAKGIANIQMSVNLSAQQLRSEDFVETVRMVMAQFDLREGDLELEVTETTAMKDAEQAAARLSALKSLGVGLAIDDFGTGYSSLAYLKRFPIGVLKLDREFVKDIIVDENDAAISAATLAMAASLGLEVVAEGVETQAQRDFLGEHKCCYLQGYLFGKPEDAAHWEDLLLARSSDLLQAN